MKKITSRIAILASAFLLAVPAGKAAAQQAEKSADLISVVPYPNDVKVHSGFFNAEGAVFHIDDQIDETSTKAIRRMAEALSLNSGTGSTIVTGTGDSGFIFLQDNGLEEEAYEILSTAHSVQVKAAGLNGFLYAIETLKQLLPEQIYGRACKKGVEWKIPCLEIKDAPRFGYRGMHLDVARHFYNVEEVERYLDIMAFHKMNRFHWHLTDDQGWRIEIKRFPKLTETGSVRKGTMIGKDWNSNDNIPYGGFYTQEEIKEVIAYAAERGITIIPEIDLPGHMLAALAAYPEYGCTGGPYEVRCQWGISDEVLCAGKEKSMEFLEGILEEVAVLFPGEYIHIGGDECPKKNWEKCPDCQAKINELGLTDKEGISAEAALQGYVTDRIGRFLAEKGKKVIGWDEILEGNPRKDAIIMSWRGTKGGIEASKKGHDAIMTPNTFCYFDHYQSTDTEHEPLAIGNYLPVRKCYSYEPFTKTMTAEQKAHILGVQANMWTEYVSTTDYLDYMILPRMSALSEVQWCQPERKDWKRFASFAPQLFRRYDVMGYNYAIHIFDTLFDIESGKEEGTVKVSLRANSEVPVKYMVRSGNQPAVPVLYENPVRIDGTCTLTAVAEWPDGRGLPLTLKFKEHKAMGASYTVDSAPEKKYRSNVENLMTDGKRGLGSYSGRDWSGWQENDMQITINMSGKENYNSVTLSTNVSKRQYIFNPEEIIISTSSDGENFKEVAKARYPVEGEHESDGIKEYTLKFQTTTDKYLRVTAKPVNSLPQWHPGRGSRGFLFVDEIIVH